MNSEFESIVLAVWDWRLLEEEIQAYYEGERELDDVLKNFQKRLKVYRLENEE